MQMDEAREFEEATQTQDTHRPGKWRLTQDFLSFGILRLFRPSNFRIRDYRLTGFIVSGSRNGNSTKRFPAIDCKVTG